MATGNPFGLLVDDDNDDLSLLIAKAPALAAPAGGNAPAKSQPAAKLPTKPLPPSEAVREARNEGYRGGGRGGGRRGGGRGFNRDFADNENAVSGINGYQRNRTQEDGERPFVARGPRRNGEESHDPRGPRRPFDRHSATGRGTGMKRDGSGPNNWGAPGDEAATTDFEKNYEDALANKENADAKREADKQAEIQARREAGEDAPEEPEEIKKEPEEKEMTLEEYEKVLEEKRKALLEMKPEERKVNLDKELASMQLLSNKKDNDEIFVKLGSDKDKRKEAVEKAKKAPVNIYLKPSEGDNYNRGGRGRDRSGRGGGRGDSGQQGKYGNQKSYTVEAPKIEDVGQFPSLGGK